MDVVRDGSRQGHAALVDHDLDPTRAADVGGMVEFAANAHLNFLVRPGPGQVDRQLVDDLDHPYGRDPIESSGEWHLAYNLLRHR